MSEEDQVLQHKIVALSGRINLHKQAQVYQFECPSVNHVAIHQAPSGAHRGRAANFFPPSHRNRTLVLNGSSSNPNGSFDSQVCSSIPKKPHSVCSDSVNQDESPSTWVSKRDRHAQLIRSSIYDKKTQQRTKDIAETRERTRHERDQRETERLRRHFSKYFQHDSNPSSNFKRPDIAAKDPEVLVEGARFRVANGGSRLVNISGISQGFPRRIMIAGVAFFRSKNGNYYRAGLIRSQNRTVFKKVSQPCPRFSLSGHCSEGPRCRYSHDPNKVAICKDYLTKGSCNLNDDCDLSHICSPHRVPACVHFLRGNCTNDNCRYAHVHVNPGSPICHAFAKLGYCESGATCLNRHVSECPDYANKGICHDHRCRLPHVDRAGRIRKANGVHIDASSPGHSDDFSSEENDIEVMDEDDIDSDNLEDTSLGSESKKSGYDLQRQLDFVKF